VLAGGNCPTGSANVRAVMQRAGLLLLLLGWSGGALAGAGEPPRLVAARTRALPAVKALFAKADVPYPPPQLYVRVFKAQDVLEVWAGKANAPLTLIKSYPVCARSGGLGPKRMMGDMQVPEGFYEIDRFNPHSAYHLSLGLNYPNASDRARSTAKALGGDIFIHGDCVTIGCVPLEDGPVEEVFVTALDTRNAGLRHIPVHVFPARLDAAGLDQLKAGNPPPDVWLLWNELAAGYRAFEETRRLPKVRVDKTGKYVVTAVQPAGR
jgi:murein L,D-transpeptidase YafK